MILKRSNHDTVRGYDSESNLLGNFPNPVLIINSDSSIRFVNSAFERLTGFSPSNLVGRCAPYPWTIDNASSEGDLACSESDHDGTNCRQRLFQKQSGERFWVEVRNSVVTYETETKYTLETWVDITAHKRAEEALKESEERFQRLSEASFEGACIHENSVILDANQAHADIFGYSLSEIIGKNVMDFVSPESRSYVVEKLASKFEGTYEAVFVRKDGVKFLAEVSGKEAHFRGREARVVATRDITQRKHMENKLRESEERLRAVFESIAEGVTVCDLTGRILDLNNAAVRLYGFDGRNELIGGNILSLIAGKDHVKTATNMRKILQMGAIRQAKYRCVRKDGTEFDAERSIALMRNKSGKPSGFVSVIRDITERERLRENMQYYISQITKAQEEERRRIACELHDETVQSLATVSLELEALKRTGGSLSADTATRRLGELNERIRIMMRSLRNFSHELRPDILDRMGLVPALKLLTEEMSIQGTASFRIEVNRAQRRLSGEMELLLFRIAQEAMRNVRKHSKAAEALVHLEFSGETVTLRVTDNGAGFEVPREMRELVTQGKMGLVGMAERARLLDASFTLSSQPGKGTTVAVMVKA